MTKKIIFFFFICSLGFSQDVIKIGQKSPIVNITDWLSNVPKDKNLERKFIVLEFWATWCIPCLKNVPHLNSLQKTFSEQKDLYFLSITNEEPIKVKRLLEKIHFSTIVVTDESNQTQIKFGDGINGISRLPLTVLIDNNGIIKWIGSPEQLNENLLLDFLSGKLISDNKNLKDYDAIFKKQITSNNTNNHFEKFLSLVSNDSIDYFFEMKESLPNTIKESSKVSKAFYLKAVSIKDILLSLGYNPHQITLDEKNLKAFDLVYKNKNFNEESLNQLEKEVIKYIGFDKTVDSSLVKVKKIEVVNRNLLSFSKVKSSSILSISKEKKIYYKFTLENLFNKINKTSDSYYFISFIDNNYYDFEIDLSSEESIVRSLSNYGIRTIDSLEEIMVYRFNKITP